MGLLVLVADDIAESRAAASAQVVSLGHRVVETANGTETLARLAAGDVDLVLLDLLMPDMDGFEVTRRMRGLASERWLPIIVTSSLQGVDHFIHALEQGADDCLARPLHMPLLAAKLRHYQRVLALQQGQSEATARQRTILDNVVEPVLTLDHEGLIQDHNHAAASLCDMRGVAVHQGMRLDALCGESWPASRDLRQLQLRRLGGQRLVVEPGWSCWQGQGKPHHTVVMRDVSEQQHVRRMQEEFLATVSHELRTPLTSLLGAIGLIAGGAAGELPARAKSLAQLARRNGERLGRLIDDVLDLTKIEGDRLTLRLRPLVVSTLLEDAVANAQTLALAHEIKVVFESTENAKAAVLPLDGERFQQIVANLLSNAVKHSPHRGLVRVMLNTTDHAVRVTVRDQGAGVPAEFRARLFEKFAQADGTDGRPHSGTGLGLHISRLLVERMSGRIEVDDVEGAGASFSMVFPLTLVGDDHRTELLLVDAAASSAELLHELAGDLVRITHLTAVPTTHDVAVARVVLANPQSQGDADAFLAALRRAVGRRPLLLWSDSVDAHYAARVGLPWVPGRRNDREALRAWIRANTIGDRNRS